MSTHFSLSTFIKSLTWTPSYTRQVRYKKSFLKALCYLVKPDIHYQSQEIIVGSEDSREREDTGLISVTSGNRWFQVTKSHSGNLKTEFHYRHHEIHEEAEQIGFRKSRKASSITLLRKFQTSTSLFCQKWLSSMLLGLVLAPFFMVFSFHNLGMQMDWINLSSVFSSSPNHLWLEWRQEAFYSSCFWRGCTCSTTHKRVCFTGEKGHLPITYHKPIKPIFSHGYKASILLWE